MKTRNKEVKSENLVMVPPQPTGFELVMNFQCDMRAELGLPPLPHWKKTRETPLWVKNIHRKMCNTIFDSILKLRPMRNANWRYYGRMIGITERYRTFLAKDIPAMLKAEKLDQLSDDEMKKLEAIMGEKMAREYYLKILNRDLNDDTPLDELVEAALQEQLLDLEKQKELAFYFLAEQDAKTTKLFLKGMNEGYSCFLNEDGEFSGDDRRLSIHVELLGWQYEIEKMRRSIPQKYNKHLVAELKKNPKFKNRSDSWFDEVFKDIKLSIGQRGRPRVFSMP